MTRRNLLSLVVLLVIFCETAYASHRSWSSIEKQDAVKFTAMVLDVNHDPVANAKVTFSNRTAKRKMRTDGKGRCKIELPAGLFHLRVEASGFYRNDSSFNAGTHTPDIVLIQLDRKQE
jgi:hypothetical protein